MDTINKIRFEINKKALQVVEKRLSGLTSKDLTGMSEEQLETHNAEVSMLNRKKEKHAAACSEIIEE